ncbi:MAG: uracil-DNA glycosylase [Planctomycetes bacterium]|nr:uracil-DNA glycosylase [Planctomycetota bacterium]
MSADERDPREELRELAGALAAHLGRAERRRRRRLAPSSPAASAPVPAASPSHRAPAAPRALRRAGSPVAAARAAEPAPAALEGPAPAALEGPARSAEDVRRQAAAAPDLETLRARVAACEACALCRTRTHTVFADGSPAARVAFVGEAPGFHEDQQGVPFVGDAGKLLTDIITKGMKLRREDVYIANVLKCRPPDNRDPSAAEKEVCTPWLERQLELVAPAVVIPLGRHAAGHLLGREDSMGRMRGRVHEVGGRKVVATYHPAYLLRTPSAKKDCWQDIQLAMRELGLAP